jgi:putative FmdB family regulatory protein
MPLYEYTCLDCDTSFEFLMRNSEQAVCPRCQGTRLEKSLSVIATPKGGVSVSMPQGPIPGECGADACQRGCQFE